ncbi:MAG: uracil-DNA glycosylase [Clostridia bacterium]|nr:uracil-DNA glycosylase [Clostridia bacterium]
MQRDYNGWEDIFLPQFEQPYFAQLKAFLVDEYNNYAVYPDKKLLFNAFDTTARDDVRVVILGQDPYANPGQAMGLAFSVPTGVRPPPSLINILTEVKTDTGYASIIKDGNLTPWANQGVLLLNSVMSVRAGQSASHANHGWETFTDSVINGLAMGDRPLVFMLWGNYAQGKKKFITCSPTPHLILTAPHPSPLSSYQGFFGCKHFSKANTFLSNFNREINW